ncbi:MAG: helix-turn-helix domain-containing protein [Acidobacteriota bacterium]
MQKRTTASSASPVLILTSQAARILNVAPETVRVWEGSGRLRAVRTAGGVRLFDLADVQRLVEQRDARALLGRQPSVPEPARAADATVLEAAEAGR